MMLWFTFGVPAGQALVIAGFLDVWVLIANWNGKMPPCVYEIDVRRWPQSKGINGVQLAPWLALKFRDYLELTQAGIEGSKIILAMVLWIGVILIGRLLVLKVWIYLTIAVDLLQLLLIGVINYHFWLTDVKSEKYVSPFHFIYITIIRLLMRAYLIVVAMNYTKTYAKFRSKVEIATSTNVTPAIQRRQEQCQNELAKELMPIGMGFCKLFQFYLIDADRLARFLLISDFVWCVCKVLSREVSQAVFGREELFYPSSSYLTPILVEERFIRISRILFDVYFLQAIHKKTLAHHNWWILPKVMETIISVGILIFVIVTEKQTFPRFVTILFCIFNTSDIVYRILLVGTCLKSYTNHCEKNLTSNLRKRNLTR